MSTQADNWWKRFRPHIALVIVAIVFFAVAGFFAARNWQFWFQLTISLGGSVAAVALVSFLWALLGGDPLARAVGALVRAAFRQLKELDSLGMSSIKLPRRDFFPGGSEGITTLCQFLVKARQVDMMAETLDRQMAMHEAILASLRTAIQNNRCTIRIVTLHPGTDQSNPHPLVKQRADEEDNTGRSGSMLRNMSALKDTWTKFTMIQEEYARDSTYKDCVQLRWTNKVTIYTNIIRIDDRMWVSPYMSSKTGGGSPLLVLEGNNKALFDLYQKEFDHVFEHARQDNPYLDTPAMTASDS